MQIRVYYEDTDCGGVVYHSNYLKFIERARSELFFARGLSPHIGNAHFVVTHIDARFLRPAKLGDQLAIKTTLIKLQNASFSLDQRIFLGELELFNAVVDLAFVENGKPKRIDQQTKELIATLC